MPNKIDLTGKQFGRLQVKSEQKQRSKDKRILWFCECECGNTCIATGKSLVNGNKRSCGCLHKEVLSKMSTTHGMSKTKLYLTWKNMKLRCKDSNNRWYGKQHISVCEEWVNSSEKFLEWALANGYADNLTVDRIDSSGNYEPSNFRWATPAEQSLNRRANRILSFQGKQQCVSEWARERKLSPAMIRYRLDKKGWSVDKALSMPRITRHAMFKITKEMRETALNNDSQGIERAF